MRRINVFLFRDTKIGLRLLLSLFAIILLMTISSGCGILSIKAINRGIDDLLQVYLPISHLISTADRELQDALLAERALLVADPSSGNFTGYLQEYKENGEQAKQHWQQAASMLTTKERQAVTENLNRGWKNWEQLSGQITTALQSSAPLDGKTALLPRHEEVQEAFAKLLENNEILQQANEQVIVETQTKANSLYRSTVSTFIVNILCVLLVAIFLTSLLTRSIVNPLKQGITIAEEISFGRVREDLKLDIDQKDEMGQLATAINDLAFHIHAIAVLANQISSGDLSLEFTPRSDDDKMGIALLGMLDGLRSVVGDIAVASGQINIASNQIADASQSLSQGTTESASSLEEITASITQVSEQVRQNADNARVANQLSETTQKTTRQGSEQMGEMLSSMNKISQSSQDISKVVKVIDDIAFQTNLLALNAAVEAARAGNHGKGFAVVAEEVRNLAAHSAKAASETAELIENSVSLAERGVQNAQNTEKSLYKIMEGTTKVADLLQEIDIASSEQASAIAQVTVGLAQIDQVTQQNTANAEESAAAAEELAAQSQQLKEMVSRFTLPKSMEKELQRSTAFAIPALSGKPVAASQEDWPQGSQKVIALNDMEFGKF